MNVGPAQMRERWPRFWPANTDAGFGSVHALPLRLREEVIGGINLFCVADSTLSDDDLALGQALADVATIGMLHERTVRGKEVLSEQLQAALSTRILIEQAKGVLAERTGLSMDEAFALLRRYARGRGRKLTEVATALIDGAIVATELQNS